MSHRMKDGILRRGKRWAAVVSLGRSVDTAGKVHRRQVWRTFATYDEARAYRVKALAAVQDSTFAPPSKQTLGDFLREWLPTIEAKIGPGTAADHKGIIAKHFDRAPEGEPDLILSALPLSAIRPEHLERYFAAKAKEPRGPRKGQKPEQVRPPLSGASLHKHFTLLNKSLRAAVRWGRLSRNPAAMIEEKPKGKAAETPTWDVEEARLFLAAAKRHAPREYPVFLTAALTGLRIGELAGLEWGDFSEATATLNVQRSFRRLGKQQLTKDPKTEAGRRLVTLSPVVVEVLAAVKRQQVEDKRVLGDDYQDAGRIFCQVNGRAIHPNNLAQRTLKRLIKKAGLRQVTLHSLRHLHMSCLNTAGVSVRTAMERMGHSDARVSIGVYSHSTTKQHREAAEAVEAVVLGRASG